MFGATALNSLGVAGAAGTTHDLRGTWTCCGTGGAATQTWNITSMDLASGAFSGDGSGNNLHFPISGSVTGDSVVLRTGPYRELPSYSADWSGSIAEPKMSGSWKDTSGQTGTWTATRAGPAGGGATPPPPVVSNKHADRKTGVITVGLQAPEAGTFEATATVASKGKGKGKATGMKGSAKRAANVLYGAGSVTATGAGPVTLTISPTPAGKAALRRRRQLSITVHLTFRSSARLGSTASSKDFRIKVRRRRH